MRTPCCPLSAHKMSLPYLRSWTPQEGTSSPTLPKQELADPNHLPIPVELRKRDTGVSTPQEMESQVREKPQRLPQVT